MCACVCPTGALPASYAKKGSYAPAGEDIDLGGGTRAYATGDPRWRTAVIVMHDVFGPDGGHHRALCDALAAAGHYVVMPDFYDGGSIEPFYVSPSRISLPLSPPLLSLASD